MYPIKIFTIILFSKGQSWKAIIEDFDSGLRNQAEKGN